LAGGNFSSSSPPKRGASIPSFALLKHLQCRQSLVAKIEKSLVFPAGAIDCFGAFEGDSVIMPLK